jgi:hypothetical protein
VGNEKAGVSSTTIETKCEKKLTKAIKPSSRSLLETIQGTAKLANMSRFARIDVPWRLFHIDRSGKGAMKEGILDV